MLPTLNALPGEIRGYAGARTQQIHYREQGAGVPLLLIHQAMWSSIHYHKIMPLMAERGFRVIAPDMPGHGMSSPLQGEASIEAYAATMIKLMDSLRIDRIAAAGHHGGSLTAAHLAAAFPDRISRIAFDTIPVFNAEERASLSTRARNPCEIKPDGSHFTDRWQGTKERGDPAWSDETLHIAVTTYFLNGPWRDQSLDAAFAYDFETQAARIACPTLAVFGRTDPIHSHSERLRALRPDFSYDEFPGAAAMILERPDEWVEKMAPFLGAAY